LLLFRFGFNFCFWFWSSPRETVWSFSVDSFCRVRHEREDVKEEKILSLIKVFDLLIVTVILFINILKYFFKKELFLIYQNNFKIIKQINLK